MAIFKKIIFLEIILFGFIGNVLGMGAEEKKFLDSYDFCDQIRRLDLKSEPEKWKKFWDAYAVFQEERDIVRKVWSDKEVLGADYIRDSRADRKSSYYYAVNNGKNEKIALFDYNKQFVTIFVKDKEYLFSYDHFLMLLDDIL